LFFNVLRTEDGFPFSWGWQKNISFNQCKSVSKKAI